MAPVVTLVTPTIAAAGDAIVAVRTPREEYDLRHENDDSDDSDISFGTWLFENTLPDPFQAIRQGARGILVRELCYMPSDVILGYSVGCGWFRACVSETRQENMRQHAARHPGTVLPCQMVDGELGGWLSWRPYEFHQKPLQDRDLSAVLARWAIEWWHLASHVALMDAAVAQPLHHGDWGAFDRAIARGLDFLICPVHFSVGMRVSGIGTGHWGLLVAHVSQGIVQYTDSMGNLSCGVYVEALVRGGALSLPPLRPGPAVAGAASVLGCYLWAPGADVREVLPLPHRPHPDHPAVRRPGLRLPAS